MLIESATRQTDSRTAIIVRHSRVVLVCDYGMGSDNPRAQFSVIGMLNLIFEANIAHLENVLATETDAKKIAAARKLLKEQKHKLAKFNVETDASEDTTAYKQAL